MKNPMITVMMLLLAGSIAPSTVAAQNASERAWLDHEELVNRIQRIEMDNQQLVMTEIIGESLDGRPITAMRISRPGDLDPEKRPAILLVAGIDADHVHGADVAIEVVEDLVRRIEDGDEDAVSFLTEHTLYVVPRVNPDGTEKMLDGGVLHASSRNTRPDDADRDRAFDEDGPEDLNGDGMITMMRIYDPRKGTMIADPDEPRLDRKPDRAEGERPEFYLAVEGWDNDEDGLLNEDGPGGVDLNMNFMHGYKPHLDGAGRHQLSEPESMALLQYALDHQTIAAVVVYGRHDTLSAPPKESGRNKAGAPNTIDADDADMYAMISDRFVKVAELENVDQPDWSGSFTAWAYGQYGVPSFSTPLWNMPRSDAEGGSEPATDEQSMEMSDARPSGGQGRRGRFDSESFMDEFDTNGDGELDDDERAEARDTMRGRMGGRRGGHSHGGPPSDEFRIDREEGSVVIMNGPPSDGPSDGEQLTPSGIGDISMETMMELREWAVDQGYPVPDDESMMSRMTPEMVEGFAQQAGIEIRRVSKKNDGGKRKRAGDAPTDEDWLAYSDASRDGEGFVNWTVVEHPDYERVEVGGWAPMFRTVPPIESLRKISGRQTDFIMELARHLPDVELRDIEVRELSEGLWEVKASLVNEGRLPAGTAMAKRNRRARPWVVRLDIDPDDIVTGRSTHKVWRLEGDGGRHEMRWVIEHPGKEPLDVELFSEKYGQARVPIQLTTDDSDGGAM